MSEHTLNLTAIDPADLEDEADAMTDDSKSFASLTVDEEDHTWSVQLHKAKNTEVFAEKFVRRRLCKIGLVEWKKKAKGKYIRLHASYLGSWRLLNPEIYRHSTLFKNGTLNQFIRLCRSKRGEDPAAHDTSFAAVLAHISSIGILEDFTSSKASEPLLYNWLTKLATHVSVAICGKDKSLGTQTTLGLRGALLYTSPRTLAPNSRAGYVGRADFVFPCGDEIFGAAELKMAGEGRVIWYKPKAILAQILCSMSGTIDTRVGLVLTDGGWKLLYRIPRELPSDLGDIIFDYYLYPPDEEGTGMSFYQPCDAAGLKTIVRIVYELIKVVTMSRLDELPKVSRMSTYRFMIARADGSLMPFEGSHLPADFYQSI